MVRLDSFAKFLAPGLRLGWATGAPAIIGKLAHCVAGTSLGACATTQVPTAALSAQQKGPENCPFLRACATTEVPAAVLSVQQTLPFPACLRHHRGAGACFFECSADTALSSAPAPPPTC